MWTVISNLIAAGLAAVLVAGTPDDLSFEAEALAEGATITGGGDLLIVGAPEGGSLQFSGGEVLTFVPRGKGAQLELVLLAPKAGVYRLMIRAVMGPSSGIYDLVHEGRPCGSLNLSAEKPTLRPGLRSHRMLLAAGDNRITFRYLQQGRRSSCLVLDSLKLEPHVPPPPPKPDPYEPMVPVGERHGPELVVNGGFEGFTSYDHFGKTRRSIRHWQFNSAVPAKTKVIVRDPSKARSGKQAILLAPDPLDDYAILYQTFRAETGKRYRVSFHARGEGYIRVDFYQYGGNPQHQDSLRTLNNFKLTENWRQYSFIMSPSKPGNVNRVAIALHGLPGGAYFDDVSVREVLGTSREP